MNSHDITELRRLHDAATRYDTDGKWLTANLDKSLEFAVAAHGAMPKLLDKLESYRAAMRQAVINAGGIAEPEVSDSFLLENVPAEMAALRAQLNSLTIKLNAYRRFLEGISDLMREFK